MIIVRFQIGIIVSFINVSMKYRGGYDKADTDAVLSYHVYVYRRNEELY